MRVHWSLISELYCNNVTAARIQEVWQEFCAFYHLLSEKLHRRWKTCQTHLASIFHVYKFLLSKPWFYIVSGPFLQIKLANMCRWNIFLIECLRASPQIKMAKRLIKSHASDRSSFLHQHSVKFQFGWHKLCYNIPLARLLQKHVGFRDSSAKYQKSVVCLHKICLMVVLWKRTFYRNDDLSMTCSVSAT